MNTRRPPNARTLPFHRAMARGHTLGLLHEAEKHGIEIRLNDDGDLDIKRSKVAPDGLLFRIGAAKAELIALLQGSAKVIDLEAERKERLPRIRQERMRRECRESGHRMGWQRPPRPRQPWHFDDGPPGGNAA